MHAKPLAALAGARRRAACCSHPPSSALPAGKLKAPPPHLKLHIHRGALASVVGAQEAAVHGGARLLRQLAQVLVHHGSHQLHHILRRLHAHLAKSGGEGSMRLPA